MFVRLLLIAAVVCLLMHAAGSIRFKDATGARLDHTHAIIGFASGRTTIVPLASLTDKERAFLSALSASHPLAFGNSKVTVLNRSKPTEIVQSIELVRTSGSTNLYNVETNLGRRKVAAASEAAARALIERP